VLRSQAECLLARGQKDRAAQIYSCSDADFDMVVLRILDLVPPIPSTPHVQVQGSISGYGGGAGTGVGVGAGFGGIHSSVIQPVSEDVSLISPQASSSSAALLQFLLEKLSQLGQGSVSGLGHTDFNSSQVRLDAT
jgi:hypothetical protein